MFFVKTFQNILKFFGNKVKHSPALHHPLSSTCISAYSSKWICSLICSNVVRHLSFQYYIGVLYIIYNANIT